MNQENDYYLEYSLAQKCFHVAKMASIQECNLKLILRNLENGYIIIAGPDTANNLLRLSEELEKCYPNNFKRINYSELLK